ncbi:MAG: molybdopterin-dependent oxidoreductase [Deltaproteobacteria bacterium]|jgi:DMSO/TMAO reductase YedYZ molybdopterin-dependent catalytic subunit|nr:molybdopterin-dependent oxidoreductase [Deltaproteobacteria bacterium]MBW2481864.1 molybdopterin-dependent oxidoreductase [Deltaproteobacteria bacterium]
MGKNKKITRRDFMAAAGGTLVSIGLPGVFVKLMDSENRALAAELRPDGRPRIPPGQHAVKALPNMGGTRGDRTVSNWRLEIGGEAAEPRTLKYDDLMDLKQMDLTCDVHCVTGWTLLDSRWRGVPVKTIMDLVQVKDSARFVIFEAAGDYSSNIPISEARKDNVILAHSYAGSDLPHIHGAPVRGLVPDRYFYKSVKWLKAIRFEAVDEPGYYESSGYSNSADPWKEERFD